MNTETNTLTFNEAEASFKPTLACVGTVGELGDAKLSTSKDYIVQPIKIEAMDAGQSTTVYFLYRPEWFKVGFKLSELKEDNPGAYFVYGKNIRKRGDISSLRGLAGSEEAFGNLQHALLSLPIPEGADGPAIEDVTQALKDFFEANVNEDGTPVRIGYVLRQQRTKVVDDDGEPIKGEDGKNQYILENRYEIANFFDVTEKNKKSHLNRASRSNGSFKVTYAAGVPF